MPTDPCELCGAEDIGIRLAGRCIWCYAATNDRPDDADVPVGADVEGSE